MCKKENKKNMIISLSVMNKTVLVSLNNFVILKLNILYYLTK